ncbi:TlpA family protein disulfide reductase [Sphingobacterium spiritivorum]|uniref:TlpA family protein disulfide reductase n=1 Tax=Sphingobacterium spiritivorum TaxID=258 RepID=UPI003DA50D7D
MKKLIITLLCIYAGILSAQTKTARICLDIRPLSSDSVELYLEEGKVTTVHVLKPGKNGVFEFSTSLTHGVDGQLIISNPVNITIPVYLEPGDDLLIQTDLKGNAQFSGKGKDNANVLYELIDKYTRNYEKVDKTKISAQVYFQQIAQLGKDNIAFLEAHKTKVTKGFYDYQKIKFYYRALSEDIFYPKVYSKEFNRKLSEIMPSGYPDILKKVQLSDSLLTHPEYYHFIASSMMSCLLVHHLFQLGMIDSMAGMSNEEQLKIVYDQAKKQLSGKVRSTVMFTVLNALFITSEDAKVYKPFLDQFVYDGGSDEDAAELLHIYNTTIKLTVEKEPPVFTLDDLEGKKVSLKDFAGKVVYIDFWASWCSPCRAEMKNGAPVLHARLADNKDMVFLYISIDDSEDKWRKAINEDQIEGIHLLSKGGVKSPVARAFNIAGVPRYVIIGRDGRVIDSAAPRPSENIAYDKLMEALTTN